MHIQVSSHFIKKIMQFLSTHFQWTPKWLKMNANHFWALMGKWGNMNNSLHEALHCSMLCSRVEWESTQCSRPTGSSHTHPSATLDWMWVTYSNISWGKVQIIFHAHQLKTHTKMTDQTFTFYKGDYHYLPTVSPLLSSGFVPGLFSWSTVCALDEEHPMLENKKSWDE